MLGQHIAVPILLPRAVNVLVKTPLAEGDYYAGDLLHVVVRLPDPAWRDLPTFGSDSRTSSHRWRQQMAWTDRFVQR